MTKAKPIFRQVDAHKYSKLGVRRKKKVKYRFPNGRDNKIRLNYAGRLRKVKVGFKNQNDGRHLIQNKKIVRVENVNDLKKIGKGMIGILGKIGSKNKKTIAEKIIKDKIEIYRFDAAKFLKDLEIKMKENKDKKTKRISGKVSRDKKAKEKAEKDKKDAEKKKADEEKKKEDKVDSLEKKTEEKKEKKVDVNVESKSKMKEKKK
jgi:ribosomal protein L32E